MSGTVSDLWALTDNLGSVRDVVDSNGKARIRRNFDAFGNVVDETHYNASGATVNSGQTGYVDEAFAFTGRYFDKATGLQNNVNRWYDPTTGRWLSEDPIGLGPDANLYRYVGNSPTNYTDPTGEAWYNPWDWYDYWFPPIATQGPVGVTELGCSLEAAPPIIRIYDMDDYKMKYINSIGTPNEEKAFREWEEAKKCHRPHFD